MTFKKRIAVSLFLTLPTAGLTHEFWLEPETYQVNPGEKVGIHLRNGQDFKGVELSWFQPRVQSASIILNGKSTEYKGLPGDLPGISVTPPEGLVTISYASTMSKLTYESWGKVLNFVGHKGVTWFEKAHANRGLPQEKVTEGYWRYSKTIIGGGAGKGSDTNTGMETEFVLQTNPFERDVDSIQVILLYQGQPRPNAQIEMWDKVDDTITKTMHTTNSAGVASLPVAAGHSYQIDAVVLREPLTDKAIETGVMWESVWANMTFAIPQ